MQLPIIINIGLDLEKQIRKSKQDPMALIQHRMGFDIKSSTHKVLKAAARNVIIFINVYPQ